jgi:hypothetical protein
MRKSIYISIFLLYLLGGCTKNNTNPNPNPTPTTQNPLPTILNLTPNTIKAGNGDVTITIVGTNFISKSIAQLETVALATSFNSSTQLTAVIPSTVLLNAGTLKITVVSPAPGGGTSNSLVFTISAVPVTTIKKILFDASHGETAGNADWVIDSDNTIPQRTPTPAATLINSSTLETYWTGALSSWGIGLVKRGYSVETLSQGDEITYGNTTNTQDLSNYNVFVVDEPNKVFTPSEKIALLNFVNAGGGLCMVSDHTISDRDKDGWDSPAIWNDLMSNNTQKANPFGFTIDLLDFSGNSTNLLTGVQPILKGTEGTVSSISFFNGTSATMQPTSNNTVKGLIWAGTSTQNNSNVICLTSTYGLGRVFFMGDSSPADDGTGFIGNNLYPNWNTYSHSILLLNATYWLAKD